MTTETFARRTLSSTLRDLLNTAFGHSAPASSKAQAWQLAFGSMLGALVLSAFWAAAAASGSAALAATGMVKVPMVLLLSVLCALPVSLLALRLLGLRFPAADFVLCIGSGVFAGSLVLGALAPIVAVYYHTSAAIGGQLAMISALISIAIGCLLIGRNIYVRMKMHATTLAVSIPLAVFMIAALAAMLQFIAIAAPILPIPSAFDGGFDGILHR